MIPFKVGDVVIIIDNGGGTSKADIGLTCRIEEIYTQETTPAKFKKYTVKIDRDKEGNHDRFLSPNYIRLATPEETLVFLGETPVYNNYSIY